MIPVTAHPGIVEKYSEYFSEHFNSSAFNHFQVYLTGLITGEKLNVSSISSRMVNGKHQSSLNRFLNSSPWNREEVNNARIRLLQEIPSLKINEKGYGVIDDTLTHKTGKAIEGVGKYYDHSQNRYILGHNLVTSFYVDKKKRWPINHRLYLKKDYCLKIKQEFKTKNQLAVELINDVYEKGLKLRTWLFDSWYLNPTVLNGLESHQADWVSEVKLNRVVLTPKGPIKLCKYLVQEIPRDAYKQVELDGKTYQYFTKAVKLKSLQGRKIRILALFENKNFSKDPRILATNKLNWTSPRKIYKAYSYRWSQETFYRDSKQNLGLEDYQLRSIKAIQKHWCLVEVAYSFLTIAKINSCFLEKVVNQISTLGQAAQVATNELLRSFVYWIHKQLAASNNDPELVYQAIFT